MGIAQIPAASSGLTSAIRSIQRGSAASAGNITITSVTTSKTIVNSFATSFSGTVAASASINAANGNTGAVSTSSSSVNIGPFALSGTATRYGSNPGGNTTNTGTINAMNVNGSSVTLNSTSLTGGTTNLAASGAYLTDATTLTTTGACRYEVIEYF